MRTRQLPFLLLVPALAGAIAVATPPTARAQVVDEESPFRRDDERPSSPASATRTDVTSPLRLVAGLGLSLAIRALKHGTVTPSTIAPLGLQADLGVVLPGRGTWRHALVLSTVANLASPSSDERLSSALSQWTLVPSYMAYLRLSRDLLVTARVGWAQVLTSAPNGGDLYYTMGFEAAGGAAYYLTAGMGLWGQIGASLFLGAEQKAYLLVGATVGLLFDWEVLS